MLGSPLESVKLTDSPPSSSIVPPGGHNHNGQRDGLKKSLSLWDGFNLVVGSIIGSGIFASPGVIYRHTQSGGASLLVWTLGGIIAYCGAMCYVELALLLPSAGGEVTYLTRFFGKRVGFLFTWANATVSRPAAFAITCIVCGQYLCRFAYGDKSICEDATSSQVTMISFGCAVLVFLVNVLSSQVTSLTLRLSTATSVFALAVAVMVGIAHSMEMKNLSSKVGFEGTTKNYLDWSPSFLAALWAYDGWNTLNYASEELSSADDFVKIIRLSIPFVTLLFVFVNASYLVVLPPDVVASSETIGVDLALDTFGPWGARVMPLFVATSAFGAAVGNMFSGARLVFSSARDGTLPSPLAHVSRISSLPSRAVFCQTILGCAFLFVGNFEELVGMFSCATWVFYLATVVGLIRSRYVEPNLRRPFKVNLIYAIVFALTSFLLVLVEFLSKPKSSLAAFAFILAGIPFYSLQSLPFFRRMCCFRRLSNGMTEYDALEEEEEEQEAITYKTFS